MKVSRLKLAAVLAQQSLGRVDEGRFSEEIAAYLLSERRVGELDSLLRDIQQYRADHGIVEVIAASAHPLDDATRREIERVVRRQYPDAKQIIISPEIEPDVIGGVRLELANSQLDLSVRAKLNRFKQLTTTKG